MGSNKSNTYAQVTPIPEVDENPQKKSTTKQQVRVRVCYRINTQLYPYQVLGLHEHATVDEIEHAYRILAFRWHPGGCWHRGNEDMAESNLKKIAEARGQSTTPPRSYTHYSHTLNYNDLTRIARRTAFSELQELCRNEPEFFRCIGDADSPGVIVQKFNAPLASIPPCINHLVLKPMAAVNFGWNTLQDSLAGCFDRNPLWPQLVCVRIECVSGLWPRWIASDEYHEYYGYTNIPEMHSVAEPIHERALMLQLCAYLLNRGIRDVVLCVQVDYLVEEDNRSRPHLPLETLKPYGLQHLELTFPVPESRASRWMDVTLVNLGELKTLKITGNDVTHVHRFDAKTTRAFLAALQAMTRLTTLEILNTGMDLHSEDPAWSTALENQTSLRVLHVGSAVVRTYSAASGGLSQPRMPVGCITGALQVIESLPNPAALHTLRLDLSQHPVKIHNRLCLCLRGLSNLDELSLRLRGGPSGDTSEEDLDAHGFGLCLAEMATHCTTIEVEYCELDVATLEWFVSCLCPTVSRRRGVGIHVHLVSSGFKARGHFLVQQAAKTGWREVSMSGWVGDCLSKICSWLLLEPWSAVMGGFRGLRWEWDGPARILEYKGAQDWSSDRDSDSDRDGSWDEDEWA
jgi:hypothetical protein